jgi:hypothetical protein
MDRACPLDRDGAEDRFRRNPVAPMPRGEGQLSHPMQSSGWTAGTSVRFCTNRAMTPGKEAGDLPPGAIQTLNQPLTSQPCLFCPSYVVTQRHVSLVPP